MKKRKEGRLQLRPIRGFVLMLSVR